MLKFSGLHLHRCCVCHLNYYEFVFTTTLLCPKNCFFVVMPASPLAFTTLWTLLPQWSLSLWRRYVPQMLWLGLSTLKFLILYVMTSVSLCPNHHKWQKESPQVRIEICINRVQNKSSWVSLILYLFCQVILIGSWTKYWYLIGVKNFEPVLKFNQILVVPHHSCACICTEIAMKRYIQRKIRLRKEAVSGYLSQSDLSCVSLSL